MTYKNLFWNLMLKYDNLINDCIWKKKDTWINFYEFDDLKNDLLLILWDRLANKGVFIEDDMLWWDEATEELIDGELITNWSVKEVKASTFIYNTIVKYDTIHRLIKKEFKHWNYDELEVGK